MADKTLIVVGGGMVGAACALRLQTAGHAVTLIEPGPATRAASFGNAGHIAVEQVEPLASWATVRQAASMLFAVGGPLDFRLADAGAWAPWSVRYLAACSRSRFREGTETLRDLTTPAIRAWRDLLGMAGASDLMVEDGHVVLWFDPRTAQAARARWRRADTGSARYRDLNADDLTKFATVMTAHRPVDGLRIDGTARLTSPQQVRDALISEFEARGGRRQTQEARRVSAAGEVELAGGERLNADMVLVAAGVQSAALLTELGAPVPLIAERGYSVQFSAPAWPTDLPTAVLEDSSIVLAPQAEGLRATSYVEFARPDSPPDPRKWRRLITRLRGLGLEAPEDCQRWMGSRPTLPDYVPAIGAWPGRRLFYAFGHQHLGITLAAITAERIEALVEGDDTDRRLDIRRFQP